jgi:hypothetical protein
MDNNLIPAVCPNCGEKYKLIRAPIQPPANIVVLNTPFAGM